MQKNTILAPAVLFLIAVFPTVGIARALDAQGPINRRQIAQVNLMRTRVLSPISKLYSTAIKECGGTMAENELVDGIGFLTGAAYTFSLVIIDQNLYLNNSRFKARIDLAFARLKAATVAVQNLQKKTPTGTWNHLAPIWNRYMRSYTVIAQFWTGKKRGLRKIQAIKLTSETTRTKVGDPVNLTVLIRYTDGSHEPVTSPDVSWLLRPDRGVTVNSARQFLAHEPGVFQVTAVFNELSSQSVVIRVDRKPRAFTRQDLSDAFLGHKQNFALVKSIACKVPDESFDALRIRILDRPARIGELKVYFADGSSQVLRKDRHEVLEPGEYVLCSFVKKRKILRFDLRTRGQGGFYSKQVIIGVRLR